MTRQGDGLEESAFKLALRRPPLVRSRPGASVGSTVLVRKYIPA